MASALELLGQKEMQLATCAEEYDKLWNVLRRLKEGEVQLNDVEIGTSPGGQHYWRLDVKPANGRPAVIDRTRSEADE